jgi:dihydroorotase-like cyclic amidohydrolase
MQSAAHFDLLVRGGTLVIPGVGQLEADVAIADGRIVALGEDLPGTAEQLLDAGGKMVLPGIFDPHTHIGNERSFEEEAETETRAAVLGGVTTIGIFLRRAEDSYLDHMPAFRRAMDERSYVDSIFHPQIFTQDQLAELPRLADEHGIRSFKFYKSGIPGIVASVSDDFLLDGFRRIAALGPDAVACVHCETGALVDKARDELRRTTPAGTLADWEKAHPAMAEALAIQTAAYLADCAGAHLYVVHLSSRDGLNAVRRCRQAGFRFTVETTTPYLGLSSDEPNGFLAKMVPPVRRPENHDALWQGLRNGEISTVGTDNTSRCRATKKPDAGLHGSRPGLPVLGTHLPVLLHYGRERGVAIDVLVDRATRGPAQVYGIYPRKGTIAVGSDADLVVVDLERERVVRAQDLKGMSDFSPFEGKRLRGWPTATIKGGAVVAREGEIVGLPTGRYIPRRTRSDS